MEGGGWVLGTLDNDQPPPPYVLTGTNTLNFVFLCLARHIGYPPPSMKSGALHMRSGGGQHEAEEEQRLVSGIKRPEVSYCHKENEKQIMALELTGKTRQQPRSDMSKTRTTQKPPDLPHKANAPPYPLAWPGVCGCT